MSYRKKIVCLANSQRDGGRCVAGREITKRGFGKWVRPISKSSLGEQLSERERRYGDGEEEEPRLLDVINIEFSRSDPKGHQQENHIISDVRWKRKKRLSWDNIQDAVECPQTLWINGFSTGAVGSGKGRNDQVPRGRAAQLQRSLYLIQPDDLNIHMKWNDWKDEYRFRAEFQYNNTDYNFSITDPEIESVVSGRNVTPVSDALLCVSLAAEPLGEHIYKLVAAIITPDIDESR